MTRDFRDASYQGDISGPYNHMAGFIAQEVRELDDLSFSVYGEEYDSSGNPTTLQIDYNSIFTYGIAATKELDAIVQTQAAKIALLEQENINLNNELTTIKAALNNLLTMQGLSTI